MPDRVVSGNHIVLLGLMGSGKTTIGSRLAAQLDRPLIDSDDLVRSTMGRTASQIVAADGLAALHEIEAKVLLDSLDRQDGAVIAAAASVVESPDCRRALANHTCLWFDADAATLATRQMRADHRRPLGDPPEELAELKRRRHPLYAELAAIRIDTAATGRDEALAVALEAAGSRSHPT